MDRVYSKKSINNAKDLRTNQTNCENILWQHLRAKRLNGIKFRRQVPVGKYIVDFVNLGTKLVVELDGSQHLEDNNLKYDEHRTEYLNKQGYTIIRFLDNEIINNLEEVLYKIVEEYQNLSSLSL